MASSDKALPVLPLRTSSAPGFHRTTNDSSRYVYEDPRELWVHHRKVSQGETGLGAGYLPAQHQPRYGPQYPQHQYPRHRQNRQSSLPLPGRNGLGISVPDNGHGPKLRRTTRTLPTYTDNTLPPSPES